MVRNAYAKLNLVLAVTGVRQDGYHLLDSIFCQIDLCDTLLMEKAEETSFSCSDPSLETPDNLVLKAVDLFSQRMGLPVRVRVHLDKRIPIQAGLGGGSADAAAALCMLSALYPGLETKALPELAVKLGADVPYFLKGGFARAEGTGEILTPITINTPLHFVVLKPEQGLSTPAVFRAYDSAQSAFLPDIPGAIGALTSSDLHAFSRMAQNVLQTSATGLCTQIDTLCLQLKSQGALYAGMTGTGSAVFGLFEDEALSKRAAHALKPLAPFCTYACSV